MFILKGRDYYMMELVVRPVKVGKRNGIGNTFLHLIQQNPKFFDVTFFVFGIMGLSQTNNTISLDSHGEMIYLKYLRRAHFVQTESSAGKKIDPSFLTELLNGVTNGSTRHIELNGYFVQRICLVIFDFAFVYHFYEA